MSKPINSNALASLIEAHGGTIVEGATLRFDLPRSEVEKVIPKINDYHDEVHVRRISERQENNPINGGVMSVVRLECFRSSEKGFNLPWLR
jgi:hypothetical protein